MGSIPYSTSLPISSSITASSNLRSYRKYHYLPDRRNDGQTVWPTACGWATTRHGDRRRLAGGLTDVVVAAAVRLMSLRLLTLVRTPRSKRVNCRLRLRGFYALLAPSTTALIHSTKTSHKSMLTRDLWNRFDSWLCEIVTSYPSVIITCTNIHFS